MLRDIFETTMRAHPDMDVFVAADDQEPIDAAIARVHPDALVVGADDPAQLADPHGLRVTHPFLRVVVTTDGDRHAVLFGKHAQSFVDPSPEELTNAIREALGIGR
jgi:hypothetical protein